VYEISEKTFAKMMKQAADYGLENQIVIVGGMTANSYEGNDINEVVISDAVCLMVVKDA
jgi:methylmalonyl-CoA mutase cobalamin-binding subunit